MNVRKSYTLHCYYQQKQVGKISNIISSKLNKLRKNNYHINK